MGDVGEERPEDHCQLSTERLGDLHDRGAERPPAQLRLHPSHQDHVTARARHRRRQELYLWPFNGARPPGFGARKADRRPSAREVVELLGVDAREAAGPPRLGEVVQGQGGRVARVVPPLEGDDEQRLAEGGMAFPAHNVHNAKVPAGGGQRTGGEPTGHAPPSRSDKDTSQTRECDEVFVRAVRRASLSSPVRALRALSVSRPRWHRSAYTAPLVLTISAATAVTDELVDAITRLMPLLSSSAPPPTGEQLQEIVSSPATTLFVARDDEGAIVGTLTLAVFSVPSGVQAWIEDVIVDTAARGQGCGEALTRAALEAATAAGARRVDLTSRSSREAANRLYQRVGFVARDTNVYRYELG